MGLPVYRIEIWQGGAKLYTITEDALSINFKDVVTENIGNFSFILPTKKDGSTYYYNDVNVFDTVKIWVGWDSVSGFPHFVGRIYNISAPLSTQQGYVRAFTGLDQGEVLKRRQKTKRWQNIAASTIITEIASDCELDTSEIESDSTQVTLQTVDEPCWNVVRKVSDYWYNAGSQIKKDFYVDTWKHLVWKSRPFRTSGVETLSVGDNILSYNVFRDLMSVKNKITAYGGRGRKWPLDGDERTEQNDTETPADDGWTSDGTLSWEPGIVGNESVVSKLSGTVASIYLKNSFSSKMCYSRNYLSLHFLVYITTSAAGEKVEVQIYAPDSSNRFDRQQTGTEDLVWHEIDWPIGQGTESDNVDYGWVEVGSPNWGDVQAVLTRAHIVGSGWIDANIDGFYLGNANFTSTAENSTSQTNYGVRRYTLTDVNLVSDSDCEKRGEALLYQMKDPPIRLDVVTPGNTNLWTGDRLSMTIPAENISSVNYDVISVEHSFSRAGFLTRAIMMNSAERRMAPPVTVNEILKSQFDTLKQIASGLVISK